MRRLQLIPRFLLLVAALSCEREIQPVLQRDSKMTLRLSAEALTSADLSTRSTKGGIEIASALGPEVSEADIIAVSYGIYDDKGHLVNSGHSDGGFQGLNEVTLKSDGTYSIYMVSGPSASGPDGIISFPADERQVSGLKYVCLETDAQGEYSLGGIKDGKTYGIWKYGLDRSGSLIAKSARELDLADGKEDGVIEVPMKALWAKICVRLDYSEFTEYNMEITGDSEFSCGAAWGNRVTVPFGESIASCEVSDLGRLPMQKRRAGGTHSFEEACVFYVPENRLGDLLPQDTPASDKTAEAVARYNGAVLGEIAEKTACVISNPVNSSWGESGSMLLRLCLGQNPNCNFDILGGYCYNISLALTPDGYRLAGWKAVLDLEDSRTLSVRAISPDSEGVEAEAYSYGQARPGREFVAEVSYGVDGEDRTVSDYNAAKGWRICASSLDELAGLGIDAAVSRRYIYMDKDNGTVISSETPLESGRYSIYGEGLSNVLSFTLPSGSYSTRIIDLELETFDGKHRTGVDIIVSQSGVSSIQWDCEPCLVAQQSRLFNYIVPDGTASVHFSALPGSEGIVDVCDDSSEDNRSCTVRTKAAGNASILIRGTGFDGGTMYTDTVPLIVRAPEINLIADELYLPMDGKEALMAETVISPETAYRCGEGTMEIAAEDKDGHGLYFAPSLYRQYLEPVAEICSDEEYFRMSGDMTKIYVCDILNDDGKPEDTLLADPGVWDEYYCGVLLDVLEIRAKDCDAVAAAEVFLRVENPFPALSQGAEATFGSIDNCILLDTGDYDCNEPDFVNTERDAVPVTKSSEPRLVGTSEGYFSLADDEYLSYSIDGRKDIAIEFDDGKFYAFPDNPEEAMRLGEYSVGSRGVTCCVTNRHSGNSTAGVRIGGIDCYLHAAVGCRMETYTIGTAKFARVSLAFENDMQEYAFSYAKSIMNRSDFHGFYFLVDRNLAETGVHYMNYSTNNAYYVQTGGQYHSFWQNKTNASPQAVAQGYPYICYSTNVNYVINPASGAGNAIGAHWNDIEYIIINYDSSISGGTSAFKSRFQPRITLMNVYYQLNMLGRYGMTYSMGNLYFDDGETGCDAAGRGFYVVNMLSDVSPSRDLWLPD